MLVRFRRAVITGICVLFVVMFSACDAKNDIDPESTFPPGPPPPDTASPAPTINLIVTQPDSVLPGQSSVITVTASDGTDTVLNYGWHASEGTVNASTTNLVTWTAPVTEGDYLVSVDVSNGSAMARAHATVRVATNFINQPLITTILPGEARAEEEIRIVGSGFEATQGASLLSIGSVAITDIVSWSNTEIIARVPADAITGLIQVTVNGVDSTSGRLTVPWNNTDPANTAVSTPLLGQAKPQAISDGAGGMIVVWEDRRNGNADIYAQRLSSLGVPLWAVNGVVVCAATDDQLSPRIIPDDGSGGAIVTWQDRRNGTDTDVYVQRINENGVAQWLENGVKLTGAAENQLAPQLASDGSNGAVVVWEDRRSGNDYDIYAQRVDTDGNVQWLADGIAVASLAEHQLTPRIASVSAGGAGVIVAWVDFRSTSHYDIYAQRLDANGVTQWTTNGISVVDAGGNQFGPSVVADGVGGAVIAWQDNRNSTDYDIYAQQLDPNGVVQWTANGIEVSQATGDQVTPTLVASGADAFIVVWEDYRNGEADIFAQRFNATGVFTWSVDGLPVCDIDGAQLLPSLVADDAKGAIFVWKDYRDASSTNIYAQRISQIGSRLWDVGGTIVSSATGDQTAPVIVADNAGGAVFVWEDYRNGNADIYAQGISASGRQ